MTVAITFAIASVPPAGLVTEILERLRGPRGCYELTVVGLKYLEDEVTLKRSQVHELAESVVLLDGCWYPASMSWIDDPYDWKARVGWPIWMYSWFMVGDEVFSAEFYADQGPPIREFTRPTMIWWLREGSHTQGVAFTEEWDDELGLLRLQGTRSMNRSSEINEWFEWRIRMDHGVPTDIWRDSKKWMSEDNDIRGMHAHLEIAPDGLPERLRVVFELDGRESRGQDSVAEYVVLRSSPCAARTEAHAWRESHPDAFDTTEPGEP